MITDLIPRSRARRAEYDRSDKMVSLPIPGDTRLHALTIDIETALSSELKRRLRSACKEWLEEAASVFSVAPAKIRVLDARPLRVYEAGLGELFGDYHPGTALIRIWMRTAVQKRVTSAGTFINTLCHEFCHHLDILQLGFPGSFHTRGFYMRTAVLYHLCRGTPLLPLIWRRVSYNRWQIDWGKMRRLRTG